MSSNQIIGICLMIFGVVMGLSSFIAHLCMKKHQSQKLNLTNSSQGVWNFTKKNFLLYLSLASLIFIGTGITLIIN